MFVKGVFGAIYAPVGELFLPIVKANYKHLQRFVKWQNSLPHCQSTMNYHLSTMNIMDFSEWLQKELNKRKWRPTDLAKRANISDAAVSRILKGERKADTDSLKAIAKALNISAEQIFRHAGLLPPENESDDWVEEMNYKITLIPPGLRSIAESFIDSMLVGEEAEPARTAKPKSKTSTGKA